MPPFGTSSSASRHHPTPSTGRNGFTLIEVLVAFVVLAIGISAYLAMVNFSSRQLWLGQRDTRVALLTLDQLERLRAAGVDELDSGERLEGDLRFTWWPDPNDSTRVLLATHYSDRKGIERADTLAARLAR